jgi:uncharacterized protein
MDPINHFEIPAKDKEKMKEFYTDVFGWKFQDIPDMNYTIVHTCEVDDKQMPTKPATINGGMTTNDPASSPVLVITVKDCEASLKKAQENGAEKIMEPTKVGDMGIYARVKDVEGNVIGIWQSLKW